MKRRTFLQGLSAAATAPLIPAGALAQGARSAGMAAAATQPYLWAEFVARVHDRASPAIFERLLKLDSDTARRVYAELLRDKVLTAPDAFGLSRAANPYPQVHVSAGIGNGPTTPEVKTRMPEPDLKAPRVQETDTGDDTPGPTPSDHDADEDRQGDQLRDDASDAEA